MGDYTEMRNTHLWGLLKPLCDEDKMSIFEAVAIFRCLKYSDQIDDVSLGNIYRQDIKRLLSPVKE